MEKRQHPRLMFREAVGYKVTEEKPDSGSLSKDLSVGGVRIRVQEFIPLRTIVDLKIHLTNPVRAVPVRGEVVWIREVPLSEVFDIGIRFLEEGQRNTAIGDFIRSKETEEYS